MSSTLEQKSTRYLLVWLPIVLLIGSLMFYIMLQAHSHHMQEKQLGLKQENVWKAFTTQTAPVSLQIPAEYIIETGTAIPQERLNTPRDTNLYFPQTKETIHFKVLTKQYAWQGKTYQISTYVSSKEFSHLVVKVFATEAFVFLLLLLAIIVINRKSAQILWKPFYTTLHKTGDYDVIYNPSLQLPQETGIIEFNRLTQQLNDLIEKVNKAYNNQKQFVENASHEIQTPLAIIRSKLDLLINQPDLTDDIAALLGDITEANDRLSQMNKSLLLLAKIDNNQFPELEQVNVSVLVANILSNYREHYDNFPALTQSVAPDVYVMANPALIEILFSNLIKNAVVHNIPNGFINIHLDKKEFNLVNTGHAIDNKPERLLERFKKGNTASKTTGLGLALVKQIARLYNMELSYSYENEIHRIKVVFGDN